MTTSETRESVVAGSFTADAFAASVREPSAITQPELGPPPLGRAYHRHEFHQDHRDSTNDVNGLDALPGEHRSSGQRRWHSRHRPE